MKKLTCFLMSMLLVIAMAFPTFAAECEIDQHYTMDGMSRSWYQGYEATIKNHTMILCVPLRAEKCVGEIKVSIALDDPNVFLLTSQPKEVAVSPKDDVYPVKLTLPLERYRRNGDFPATITVKGADAAGKEIIYTIPYVIRIRDGYGSHETVKPIISDIVGELDVGTDGSISLTISNPTTTLAITDGEVTLIDASGDILVSGSNRVKVNEILPGKSEVVTIPAIVKGNASISQHIIDVTFSYKVLGTAAEHKETFTIPVTQSIRLEQGGVQLPAAIAAELSNMTLPLMNMGKGDLLNVLVKLEIPGVIDAQSVLVGTMAAGETKQAKVSFTPRLDSVGTHSGMVTVTCEDAYGNPFSQTLNVDLTVDEPLPEAGIEQEEEEKKISKGTIILIILCVLLTVGIVVQGIILWGKIHKLEEDRL
ncbi:MAG: hypothetical protein IJ403_01520 [Oscillospiraceae bacterium]|nr:hypothetical protein [Oscillospiraceae bacterium]MBQ8807360.1 hypothetical protein [Bacteroidaceae bacterium]